MPDISMCADETCPSRETCWRFTAKPNGRHQSYGNFGEQRNGAERCGHYWPNAGWPRAEDARRA